VWIHDGSRSYVLEEQPQRGPQVPGTPDAPGRFVDDRDDGDLTMTERPSPAFDTPLEATPVDGEVVITGPAHLHAAFTPDAAEESARRLRSAAEIAKSQTARLA